MEEICVKCGKTWKEHRDCPSYDSKALENDCPKFQPKKSGCEKIINVGDKVQIWSFTLLRDAVVLKVTRTRVRVQFRDTSGYINQCWRHKKDVIVK